MAKVRGPLLSMTANGQIGKSQVYAQWRGIPYVRQLVVPSNPQTTEQTLTRDVFRFLNAWFRSLGPIGQQPWDLYATQRPFIARNGAVKINLPALREEVVVTDLIASPGARGGPAPATFTPVTGGAAGEIDVDITAGALPTGWSVVKAGFSVLHQQTPAGPYDTDYAELEVASPGPYTDTFIGLTAGQIYLTSGWLIYERPDATLAASISASSLVTAHA